MNGSEFLKRREQLQLSQTQLGKALGLTQPQVSAIEKDGRRKVRPLYARILRDQDMLESLLRDPP